MINIYIKDGVDCKIKWTILKGQSAMPEDFQGANLSVWLKSHDDKFVANYVISEDNSLLIDVPVDMPAGVYSLKAVWEKDRHGKVSMAEVSAVFAVANKKEDATVDKNPLIIKIQSNVATYGYDGLSAYELAVLNHGYKGTETEWLTTQRTVSVLPNKGTSETDTMTQKAITDEFDRVDNKLEEKVDKESMDEVTASDVDRIWDEAGTYDDLTEEDKRAITQFIAKADEAVTAASLAASMAQNYSSLASQNATRAIDSANKAETQSLIAVETSRTAIDKSEKAETDAADAKTKSENAEVASKAAEESASAAEESAFNSQESARNTQKSANEALGVANKATSYLRAIREEIAAMKGNNIEEQNAKIAENKARIDVIQDNLEGDYFIDFAETTEKYHGWSMLTRTIKAGEKFRIKMTRNGNNTPDVTFMGWTDEEAVTYQELKRGAQLNEEYEVTASIDINLIAIQKWDATGDVDFAWQVIAGSDSDSITGRLTEVEAKVAELEKGESKEVVVTPSLIQEDYYLNPSGYPVPLSGRALVTCTYEIVAGETYRIKCGTESRNDNALVTVINRQGAVNIIVRAEECSGYYDEQYTAKEGDVSIRMYSQITRVPDYGVWKQIGESKEILQIKQDIALLRSKIDSGMFGNNPLDLKKKNLRILDIGNSYTQDSTAYLPQIIDAARGDESRNTFLGNFCLYTAIRSSGSFKTCYDQYKDTDNEVMSIDRRIDTFAGGYVNDLGNQNIHKLLKNYDWDLILIHQVSEYSAAYEEWNTKGNGGYLPELLNIIRTTQPQATIGMLLVHSYPNAYTALAPDSKTRWEGVADAIRKAKRDYNIDFVIPYGTAVQNLRMSAVNVDQNADFARDNYHLAYGLGRYAAACAYYESVIYPRTEVSMMGNTYYPEVTQAELESVGTAFKQAQIDVTAGNAPIAQKAAKFACQNMFNLNNPDIE